MTYIPTADDVSYPPPLGTGTPPPTGDITVPQSPSGTSQAAPDRSQLNTESYLSTMGPNVSQSGAPAQTSAPVIAGCTSVPWNNWTGGTPGKQI
jgi:hypothetical protein